MAKKKKKNAPDRAGNVGESLTETTAIVQPAQDTDMTTQRGMPYSTAILAIVLAFVLGAVVGSVAPQFMQPQGSPQPTPVAASAPQQSAQSGQQAAQPQVPHEQLHVIQDLEKQLAKEPTKRELYVALGNACFDANLYERAIQAYEKALEMDSKDADVLTDVGIMYREIHDHDKALERFRQAQVVDPAHINAAFNEGVVLYYDLQRKPEALARWQRLLDANPAARAPNGKPLADLIKELQ